ncbi:MBL fold metallo-hydrolase [Nocardioides sp.]|uniref:MBL fold metallo-hydrolase n=1 Tax=Nocardioides sp. TaxID=35761 RepID=UPI00351908DE
MKVTIVGCSGSYPGPESPASCYLLEATGPDATGGEERTWRILLDLGNGALGALQRHVDALTIDAVFLSHLHADHCLDLCGYYVMRKYHPTGAQPRIPVYGPHSAAARIATAYDLPIDPGMTEEFDFVEYEDGEALTVGPFTVLPVRVNHPVEAYALRVTGPAGEVLAYSGDTATTPALPQAAAGADLFLCEASFRDGDENPPDIHLTGSEAGQAATEAGVKRLVLTHIPPWFDEQGRLEEARTTFSGPLELAVRGAVYEI